MDMYESPTFNVSSDTFLGKLEHSLALLVHLIPVMRKSLSTMECNRIC